MCQSNDLAAGWFKHYTFADFLLANGPYPTVTAVVTKPCLLLMTSGPITTVQSIYFTIEIKMYITYELPYVIISCVLS